MKKSFRFIFVLAILCFTSLLFGQQGNFSANSGFGLLQGYFIGANYRYSKNLTLGMDIGSHLGLAPKLDNTSFSISVENDLHFGKYNRFNQKPWYFGQQVMYWAKDAPSAVVKTISITPSLGVYIAFSEHFGITGEIGPTINFTLDIEMKEIAPDIFNWPLFPNGRLQLIYFL